MAEDCEECKRKDELIEALQGEVEQLTDVVSEVHDLVDSV